MKVVTSVIAILLAGATLVAASSKTALTILMWPLLPGMMAGVFYSAHGDWRAGAWVTSYLVNTAFYVAVAFALRNIWMERTINRAQSLRTRVGL